VVDFAFRPHHEIIFAKRRPAPVTFRPEQPANNTESNLLNWNGSFAKLLPPRPLAIKFLIKTVLPPDKCLCLLHVGKVTGMRVAATHVCNSRLDLFRATSGGLPPGPPSRPGPLPKSRRLDKHQHRHRSRDKHHLDAVGVENCPIGTCPRTLRKSR
jgi:hypothetical protein